MVGLRVTHVSSRFAFVNQTHRVPARGGRDAGEGGSRGDGRALELLPTTSLSHPRKLCASSARSLPAEAPADEKD